MIHITAVGHTWYSPHEHRHFAFTVNHDDSLNHACHLSERAHDPDIFTPAVSLQRYGTLDTYGHDIDSPCGTSCFPQHDWFGIHHVSQKSAQHPQTSLLPSLHLCQRHIMG